MSSAFASDNEYRETEEVDSWESAADADESLSSYSVPSPFSPSHPISSFSSSSTFSSSTASSSTTSSFAPVSSFPPTSHSPAPLPLPLYPAGEDDEEEEEECCPLCMEPFDQTDLDFTPCKCGYKICLYCWNNLNLIYNNTSAPTSSAENAPEDERPPLAGKCL